MSEYSFTAFMWQRIHQVPRYFLMLLDYLHSNPHNRFVVWSVVWSTLGISPVLILLSKVAHFHHISHIPPLSIGQGYVIPLNIFKDGSRLSLPSLLPQSLASKSNVILLTVPQRRVLLMLYMKIIQPFFFCLIFPCSYLQGSHLLLYLQHHTEFAFSGLCTIPPQSLTPLLFAEDICLLFIFEVCSSPLDIWLCLWLCCWTRPFHQTTRVRQHDWLITSRNCHSAHFGVMATFCHQGLYIFFHIFDKDTEEYWAKRKSYCESIRTCTAY